MSADVLSVAADDDVLRAAAGVLVPWPAAALSRLSDILFPAAQGAKREPDGKGAPEKSTMLSTLPSVFAVVASCFCVTRIDIQQNDYNTVDFVVEGAIWPDSHRIRFSVVIFNPEFLYFKGVDRSLDGFPQVRRFDVGFDVGDGPADIGWNQIHDLFGHRRKAPYAKVIAKHDDRYTDAAQQITEIAVDF